MILESKLLHSILSSDFRQKLTCKQIYYALSPRKVSPFSVHEFGSSLQNEDLRSFFSTELIPFLSACCNFNFFLTFVSGVAKTLQKSNGENDRKYHASLKALNSVFSNVTFSYCSRLECEMKNALSLDSRTPDQGGARSPALQGTEGAFVCDAGAAAAPGVENSGIEEMELEYKELFARKECFSSIVLLERISRKRRMAGRLDRVESESYFLYNSALVYLNSSLMKKALEACAEFKERINRKINEKVYCDMVVIERFCRSALRRGEMEAFKVKGSEGASERVKKIMDEVITNLT